MSKETKAKLFQFLAEEVELLEDFAMDLDESDDNRKNARAVALWSMQTVRVGAIRDVMALVELSDI